MARYFRIQPAGLGLAGHYSETSNDELSDGLHVFDSPMGVVSTDVPAHVYGDEVVVIEAADEWPNDDVEGVCIDPETAQIVARHTWAGFLAAYFPGLPERPRGADYDDCLVDGWESL